MSILTAFSGIVTPVYADDPDPGSTQTAEALTSSPQSENTDTGETEITYEVSEYYEWLAPVDFSFTQNSNGSDEHTATVEVIKNTIGSNKRLKISIADDQAFELVDAGNMFNKRTYTVKDGDETLSAGSNVLSVDAGVNTGSKDMQVKMNSALIEIAGNYSGTLRFKSRLTSAYDITYHLDGGENASSNPDSYEIDGGDIDLADPTKTGYVFEGWYTEAEFANQISTIANGTSGHIDLYAKWSLAQYTISYDLNGGTNSSENRAGYDLSILPITLGEPTKAGYTFTGWTGSNGDTPESTVTIPADTTGNLNYTANWSLNTYTLSYELNGGTCTGQVTEYDATVLPVSLPTPTKEHYTFAGWYEAEDFSGSAISEITVDNIGTKTLYAKWAGEEYTITYHLDGGTNAENNPVTYAYNAGDVQLAEPTKEGYSFVGWYTSEDLSGDTITAIANGTTGTVNLYAKWEECRYQVTLKYMDKVTEDQVVNASSPSSLPTPVRNGYTFDGWHTGTEGTGGGLLSEDSFISDSNYKWTFNSTSGEWESTGNKGIDSSVSVLKTTEFNAKSGEQLSFEWRSNAESSYDYAAWNIWDVTNQKWLSGASAWGTTYSDSTSGLTPTSGVATTKSKQSSSTYTTNTYTFTADGTYQIVWTYRKDGSAASGTDMAYVRNVNVPGQTTIILSDNPVSELSDELVLYAKWDIVNYSVTWELNGGTLSSPVSSYTVNTSYTLPTPTRTNYIFEGWYETEDFSGEKVTGIASGTTGNKTFYAHWYDNYSVTYVLNGGSNNYSNPKTYSSGKSYTIYNPSRSNYVFEGWYETEDFSGSKITSIPKGSSGDKTLYAHWYNNYNITYVLNGGTNSSSAKAFYSNGSSYTLPTPTRTDYVFEGWYTTEDFSGSKVTSISKGSTGDKTFYAHWYANYNISYVLNDGTLPEDTPTFHTSASSYTIPTPTRTDYIFEGWYETEDFSGSKVISIPVGNTSDKTFYAHWYDNYSITYVSNGGTLPEDAKTFYSEGETYALPKPVKDGYKFKGWCLVEDCSDEPILEVAEGTTRDLTLYAKWAEENCEVTLKFMDDVTDDAVVQARFVADLPTPSRNGYNFAGWHPLVEGGGGLLSEESFASDSNYKWTYNSTSGEWESTGNKEIDSSISVLKTTEFNAKSGEQISFEWRSYAEGSCDYAAWNIWDVTNQRWLSGESTWGTTADNSSSGLTPTSGLSTTSGHQSSSSYTTNTYTFTSDGTYQIYWVYRKDGSVSNGTDMAYVRNVNIPSQTIISRTPVTGLADGMTLCANWDIINYTINYELNGGTWNSDPIDNYTVATETFALPKPVKDSFKFAGWYLTEDLSGSSVSNVVQGTTGNLTLYAKWVESAFEVTLKYEDGVTPDSRVYIKSTSELPTPTRDGYDFEGWYPTTIPEEVNVTLTPSEFITEDYYTWSYNSDYEYWESTGDNDDDDSVSVFKTKEFKAASGDQISFEWKYDGNNYYSYAVWNIWDVTNQRWLSGDSNWGTSHDDSYSSLSPETGSSTTENCYDWVTNTYTFNDSGKYQIVWVHRNDYSTSYSYVRNVTIPSKPVVSDTPVNALSDNMVLSAKWGIHEYSIAYELNGGSLDSDPWNSYNIFSDTYIVPTPTKDGYIFEGWYETEDFLGEKAISIPSGSTGDKIFYAKWYDNYNITYVLNGGTNSSNAKTVYSSGSSSKYILPRPTKDGYVFEGWYETEDFLGEKVISIPSGSTGDKIYYAKWIKMLKSGLKFNSLIPSDTTEIRFTTEKAPQSVSLIDVGADNTGGIVAWMDGTTFIVSTQTPNEEFFLNSDSRYMFCGSDSFGNKLTTTRNLASIAGLENLNTSYVTYMGCMFSDAGYNATTWSIDGISSWDVSNVKDMGYMFSGTGYNATTFELDLSSWDVSNVKNMCDMFYRAGGNAATFELDLSGWDVSNVTDERYQGYYGHNEAGMGRMFQNAGYNATTWSIDGISSWDVSNVKDMSHMFAGTGYNATTLNLDLSSWDVSSVTKMNGMFANAGHNAPTFELNLSGWDTSNVTNMNSMFQSAGYNAPTFELNLSGWDTSNVTDMRNMFCDAGYNATTWSVDGISGWDVSNVKIVYSMFRDAGHNATTFELDLSSWDVSNVTDKGGYQGDPAMTYLFSGAGYNATTFELDLSNWNTSNVTDMHNVFQNAGHNATTWSIDGISGWDVSNVTNMGCMFYGAGYNATTFELDLSGWDVSNVKSKSYQEYGGFYKEAGMRRMFQNAGHNATTWSIDGISSWNVSNVKDMSYMFAGTGSNATTLNLDLSGWNVSNVIDMNHMFSGTGYNATTLNLDLSGWDTSSVTTMGRMFQNTGYNATTLNLDLSGWVISNENSVYYMFEKAGYNVPTFELDLSSWDVSSVTEMSFMFYEAGYNASTFGLDLSGWDTSSVTTMGRMFQGVGHNATTWSIDGISNWDVSNVKDMSYMFSSACYNATTLNLDLSGWDVSSVTTMEYTFHNCKKLSRIYVSDLWNVDAVKNSTYMFYGCTSLVGGNGTAYSDNYNNKAYARIDTPDTPGYLTYKAAPATTSAASTFSARANSFFAPVTNFFEKLFA